MINMSEDGWIDFDYERWKIVEEEIHDEEKVSLDLV